MFYSHQHPQYTFVDISAGSAVRIVTLGDATTAGTATCTPSHDASLDDRNEIVACGSQFAKLGNTHLQTYLTAQQGACVTWGQSSSK